MAARPDKAGEKSMNKRRSLLILLTVVAAVVVTGCYDRVDLEEQSSSFLAGIDLDQQNNLLVYSTNPVFSRHVNEKSQEIGVKAGTLRQSRGLLEARTIGFFSNRKVQIILLGKRLLEHENWYRLLDVFLRDTKNPLTQRVVAFDGAISDLIDLNPKDQPLLPIMLRGMVDSKSARSESVNTTFQELDRQMFESGVTPYISGVGLDKNKEIVMFGTTLLDKKGKYASSLSISETILLQILQKNVKRPVSYTLRIPGESKSGPFHTDRLSINAENIKTKIKTSYREDRFRFVIDINMPVTLTERLYPYDIRGHGKRLESLIAEQMKKKFESLVRTLQAQKIDPIGLGLYARAHEYKQYKDVQEKWGEALAEADIQVAVKVTIRSMGPVK
jgi:Ger(x)C family germination protein